MKPLLTAIILGLALNCAANTQTAQNLDSAEAKIEQEIRDLCAQLPAQTAQANDFYQHKQYPQALSAFERQVELTDFCYMNNDLTKQEITDAQRAIVYNNVGLTYAKLGKTKWARAWFSILKEDKTSQFNLQKFSRDVQDDKKLSGYYVRYVGVDIWNSVQVSEQGAQYAIAFNGYHAGARTLLFGPNMGDFEITMPKSANRAQYRYESCQIELAFNGERLIITQSGEYCGFGMGVTAAGEYLKVESQP